MKINTLLEVIDNNIINKVKVINKVVGGKHECERAN